jgi:NitT/TauT family transport system permease protein
VDAAVQLPAIYGLKCLSRKYSETQFSSARRDEALSREPNSSAVPWTQVRWLSGLAGIAAFLVVAEALGLVIPPSVLPRASTVAVQVVRLAGNTRFLADVGATLEAWAVGMLLTAGVAVPVGLVLGSLPGVRFATRAITEFLRPIPSVSLIPLVTLLLGSGLRTTVTLIVYGAGWPVLYNTIAGLDGTDPVAIQTMRAFGFGRLAVLRHVSLPSSAPFIATGIRIASSIALILDIGAGYITGRLNGPGIGAFIADVSSGTGDVPVILAATVWVGFLGLALNALLLQAERRLLPWHRASLGLAPESPGAAGRATLAAGAA